MGLASLMQTAAVLVKSAVKRSSIVPSASMTMKQLTLVPSLLQGRTSVDTMS
jgi:hypothetical protein